MNSPYFCSLTKYTYKSIIIIILPQTGTNINSAIRIARDFVEAAQLPWYILVQMGGHQDVQKAGNTAVRRTLVNRNDIEGDFCRCPDQWAKVACFVIRNEVLHYGRTCTKVAGRGADS